VRAAAIATSVLVEKGQGLVPLVRFGIDQILTVLAETPGRIDGLTAGLSPAELRTVSGPDDWSAGDVLAHLRSCADLWGDEMRMILAEDEPTIRASDPRAWCLQMNYPALDFATSFLAFAEQRSELLATLTALPVEVWPRTATIKSASGTRTRTLQSYGDRMARHEQTHIEQLGRIAREVRKRGLAAGGA
jgi:hypothetical protein